MSGDKVGIFEVRHVVCLGQLVDNRVHLIDARVDRLEHQAVVEIGAWLARFYQRRLREEVQQRIRGFRCDRVPNNWGLGRLRGIGREEYRLLEVSGLYFAKSFRRQYAAQNRRLSTSFASIHSFEQNFSRRNTGQRRQVFLYCLCSFLFHFGFPFFRFFLSFLRYSSGT